MHIFELGNAAIELVCNDAAFNKPYLKMTVYVGGRLYVDSDRKFF